MSVAVRAAAALAAALFAGPAAASAATPREIDAAIKKGSDFLRSRHGRGGPPGAFVGAGDGTHGIGPTCLAGLAMLEAGVPGNDPAVKAVTDAVRAAAYTQTKTYQIALCLMYLDRYGEPADEPLIQVLAVRLLVAQNANGGWGYDCVGAVGQADVERLRAIRPGQPGKLHPEVEKYAQALVAAKAQPGGVLGGDDNSNTQFGVLAVWMSRKHGVPVDPALDLIERRFRATQNPQTGGWGYTPAPPGASQIAGMGASPSMYAAGLLGLATGVARREERRPKTEAPKPDPKTPPAGGKKDPDDPFFTPPPKNPGAAEPKKRPPDGLDLAVQAAFAGLGAHVAESARTGRGALVIKSEGSHGHHDLYFLWSLERVGVIFGMEKIGGVDWYEAGAHSLVHTQGQDGSWVGSYGAEVNTSFAVLFLCKANLARDLAGAVSKETSTEMKFGTGAGAGTAKLPLPGTGPKGDVVPPPFVPGPLGSEAATLAGELLRAADKDWDKSLGRLRDAKGVVYTQAMVAAVARLDGDRRKTAREALAERLTRMTAGTLRAMAKAEDPELRRAAVLAMAMKDDKAHVPDLVAALLDDEDLVVRAARAGLKSLTDEDFGPKPNATAGEKTLASESWKRWLDRQPKK